jgi:hypothetical protein
VRGGRPCHRGRDRQRGPRDHRQLGDGPVLLGSGDSGLGSLVRDGDADPPPHPAEHQDLVFFGQGGHAAPGGRLPQVTRLRNEQFGQAFAFQYRPRRQPGEQARRQHVQPEQTVVERQAEQRQKNYIGHRDGGEDCNLPNGQRHRQAEVVELVQPFLNPPDARIGGQLHRSLSFMPGRRSVDAQCLGDPLRKRLHDAWGVKDHSDRDGKDNELDEPDDLACEQEEERHDSDDPQEQRAKETLQIRNQAVRIE